MATKRKDFTQTALDVVRRATGEAPAPAPTKKPKGGLKSGAETKAPITKKAR